MRGQNGEGKEKILGEVNLNISSYVGVVNRELQVQLNRAMPGSSILIEISITKEPETIHSKDQPKEAIISHVSSEDESPVQKKGGE